MAKKISITYEKGGVGKTTTAVNLASILAEKGYRTLLVDLDFQSYATTYFDLYDNDSASVYEVMCDDNDITAKDTIRHTEYDNLDILPCNYRFRKMETVLMMKTKKQEYTLKKALTDIETEYDFIIFDNPPNGERIKENVMAYTDFIILTTIPDDNAIQGLLLSSTEIQDVKDDVNSDLEVLGVLITMVQKNNNKSTYKEILQSQEIFPAFETVIRMNTYLSEARPSHKPINYYKRDSNGYADYLSFTEEVLQRIEGGVTNGNKC